MSNLQSKRSTIVSLGIVLILFSAAMFVAAMSRHDFGGAGQNGLFTGLSSILLIAAFALLSVLSIGLLFVVSRTLQPSVMKSPSAARKPRMENAAESPAVNDRAEPSPEPGKAAQTAEVQVQESSKLLSDTAGELRTSVDAMQEELEVLMDEDTSSDKERIESLYDETDRITKILDGMEDLAKAKRAVQSLQIGPVELQPFLNEVIEQARESLHAKDLAISLECEPGIILSADRDHFRRIMFNVLENASKAVSKSGSVIVSAARKDAEILLAIRDTGTGIRPRDLSHIFEPFYRGSGSGLGLGLAVVKELVNAHRGSIEVETKWGKGSVFTVHMPAV
jgi:signal transduction histidine kinase